MHGGAMRKSIRPQPRRHYCTERREEGATTAAPVTTKSIPRCLVCLRHATMPLQQLSSTLLHQTAVPSAIVTAPTAAIACFVNERLLFCSRRVFLHVGTARAAIVRQPPSGTPPLSYMPSDDSWCAKREKGANRPHHPQQRRRRAAISRHRRVVAMTLVCGGATPDLIADAAARSFAVLIAAVSRLSSRSRGDGVCHGGQRCQNPPFPESVKRGMYRC